MMGKWILTVVLGIFILLLALVFLFCAAKLKIHAVYRKDDGSLRVGVLFFSFRIYPKKEKKKKKRKKKEKKAKKRTVSAPTGEPGEEKEKQTKIDILALLRFILQTVREIPFERSEVELRAFRLKVAGKDAAKTALLYSGAIQLVTALFALFDKSRKFVISRSDSVAVEPDFLSEKTEFSLDLVFRMRIGTLLSALFRSLWRQITKNGGLSFVKTTDR